jgi:hypothetical protein
MEEVTASKVLVFAFDLITSSPNKFTHEQKLV